MKSVLITGGSGSFGRAFVRKLLSSKVGRIAVYSRGEHSQEEMQREFSGENRLRFFIGDVRDRSRLELAMKDVDTVIHAAALKVVPIAEYNPTECVATNIGGAENVVYAAIRTGVSKVVAISTDKAVNPINLYGATKLAAEKIFLAANNLAAGSCRFSVVRYGNVIGSRGSVLPLFAKLKLDNQSLPITDVRMTRFWIRMDQAIDLVLHAEKNMLGREVYIPKIPSINIVTLAEAFGGNYHVVGIRPGEKLHECLLTEDEARTTVEYKNHYTIMPSDSKFDKFKLPDGFRYVSDGNDHWLDVEQLKASIQ